LNNKIYTEDIIQSLKGSHTDNKYKTANLPVFLFLCGKEFEENDSL